MQFGAYELLGRVATGGSAHIFLAGQRAARGFERLVCLKTLTPERASEEDFVQSFVAEAEIASHIRHPNCVSIFNVGVERGAYFISMEYIPGETLSALLSTWQPAKPLPAPEMISILASVCDGLHYAHELCAPDGRAFNLIHRDVSPQNIMISYTGQTKVLDFGIAKAEMERRDTKTGIVKGKVRYMSPEQILSGPLDRRSDIYALGLVMFECLTGRMLFESCSPAQIQYKMLHERVPRVRDFLPSVDPQLDAICYTALQFDAKGRYPTAYVLGRELRNYLKRIDFASGRDPIAALMRDRFGERATDRSGLVERVLANQFDLAEIRSVLGIRPVMELESPLRRRDAARGPQAGLLRRGRHRLRSERLAGGRPDDRRDRRPRHVGSAATSPATAPAIRERSNLEPVAALPLIPEEDFADQTRMHDDADDTRPILDIEELHETPPEDTKKVGQDEIAVGRSPGIGARTAFLLWLFGLVLGIGLGIAGTLLVLNAQTS